MTAERLRLGWALLFIGGVLAVFFLTTPEPASHRTTSEVPVQVCALGRLPSGGAEPCDQLAQRGPSRQHIGETAWLTRC